MLLVTLLLQYQSNQITLKQQKTLLHHWIIKFGPPIYLVTDRGSEYVNKEVAHLCTIIEIRHSPRTAYSPWTNGLVEVKNRNLGTHLRKFLHDTPKD